MYLTHNKGKSVAERFIRSLEKKRYKHTTSIPKIVYTDKLDDIINEYSNTYHGTIKMKPIDVKDNTYIDSIKDVDNEDPKFQVGPHVRISKYKSIFAKRYTPYWSEDVFVISKIKKAVPRTYVINDLSGEETVGKFYEKELQKTNQQNVGEKKSLKETEKNYLSNGKIMIIHLVAG